jgi:mono/diheme cytochrome c family protein
MRTPMLVVLAALPWMMVAGATAQQTGDSATAPPNTAGAASLVNPVKPTPESQARAKKIYGYDCAMCHGANGDGKGDLVKDMKLTLKDYTNPTSLTGMSDGEMFTILKDGKGTMPGETGRAKDEDLWNMVILLRSFSKGAAEPAAASSAVRP